jgi:hypothetical protein
MNSEIATNTLGTKVISKSIPIKTLTHYEAHRQKIKSKAFSRWSEESDKCTSAIWWMIDWPAQKILYMTCLPVTKKEFDTNRVLVWAIFGPMMIILLASQSTAWQVYLMVGMPICLLFLFIFLCLLKKDYPPTWYWVFT